MNEPLFLSFLGIHNEINLNKIFKELQYTETLGKLEVNNALWQPSRGW